MDLNNYFSGVKAKFEQDGFTLQKDHISSFEVDIAKNKRFELAWLATQMNFFAAMTSSDHVTKESIEEFSKNCLDYAIKNNKGLPRGMQSGISSFALLVSSNVDEEAKKFAQKRPKKHFAAMEMPIIFDMSENKFYYYRKNPIWGFIYYKTFREFIEKYFVATSQ